MLWHLNLIQEAAVWCVCVCMRVEDEHWTRIKCPKVGVAWNNKPTTETLRILHLQVKRIQCGACACRRRWAMSWWLFAACDASIVEKCINNDIPPSESEGWNCRPTTQQEIQVNWYMQCKLNGASNELDTNEHNGGNATVWRCHIAKVRVDGGFVRENERNSWHGVSCKSITFAE